MLPPLIVPTCSNNKNHRPSNQPNGGGKERTGAPGPTARSFWALNHVAIFAPNRQSANPGHAVSEPPCGRILGIPVRKWPVIAGSRESDARNEHVISLR